MPRRRLTIAAMMILVLIIGLVAALVRSELENKALRAELAVGQSRVRQIITTAGSLPPRKVRITPVDSDTAKADASRP